MIPFGVLISILVLNPSAYAMKIRPLHDRVLVKRIEAEATDSDGQIFSILFMAVIEVDPKGNAHGIIHLVTGEESISFEPTAALVDRSDSGEATELVILVTPIIQREAEPMMVIITPLAGREDRLFFSFHHFHNSISDGSLSFEVPGKIETLPPHLARENPSLAGRSP